MAGTTSPPAAAAPAVVTEKLSVGRVILRSFRGEHLDQTTAPLNRAVPLLAVPMVLEMVMESLFSVCDVFRVSHLGGEAVAIGLLSTTGAGIAQLHTTTTSWLCDSRGRSRNPSARSA